MDGLDGLILWMDGLDVLLFLNRLDVYLKTASKRTGQHQTSPMLLIGLSSSLYTK